MININDILTTVSGQLSCIDGVVRVVGVSNNSLTASLIRLDIYPIQAPFIRPIHAVDPDVEMNGILRLDTFSTDLAASKDALSESDRKKYEYACTVMQSTLDDPLMTLDSAYRGRQFSRIAEQFNIHKRTVRRYFYAYLWGGMTDLAFAGPQKKNNTIPKKQNPKTEKRGRKRKSVAKEGQLPLPFFRENLEKGVKLFFLSGKHTEIESYVETIKKFYSNGKKVVREPGNRIKLEDIALPSEKLPSFRQFHYVASLLKKSEGNRERPPRRPEPTRQKTAQRGLARDGVLGPGYRYEIDSTKFQERIVSRLDPDKLVNEATLYIIIDVWSGALVGYALSLEPASWFLAAKALRNCFTQKTEVFERLKLPYTSNTWPSHHLPSRLAADRAELISNKAGVVPGIGIKVEIMPSMCPQRKGSVEGKFEDIKHGDNYYFKPGKHRKIVERRGNDGKKAAGLTLNELEATIVEIIIDLNNDPVPAEYLPAQAVNAGISTVTYGGLFEWGLQHRAGCTRRLDPKVVTNELMSKDTASVTPKGIIFRKYRYTSDELFNSGLLEYAAKNGHFKIEIRYDDLFADRIRYLDVKTQDWVDVFNDNQDVQRLHASFWEIEELRTKAEQLSLEAKKDNIANKGEKSKRVNETNRAAAERSKAAKTPGSRSQSKQSIRLNTELENQAERVRRLSEEKKNIPTPLALQNACDNDTPINDSSNSTPPIKSTAQRALEIWKTKNANMGK